LQQDHALKSPWTDRLFVSALFIIGGTTIFVFGNNWTSIFATNSSALYKWSLAALCLGLALLLRRSERFRGHWPAASTLFVAASANAVSWGLGNWLARLLPPLHDPALAIAVDKLSQTIPVVLTIVLLTWLVGDDLCALSVRGGNLAQALRFGGISFGIWAILFAVIAVLQANAPPGTGLFAGGVPLPTIVAALPWSLVFVLANALLEELWFRGLFLKKLRPLLGTIPTIVVTALVFGLAHTGAQYAAPAERIVFSVVVFVLGLVNAWAMLRSNSIWGSLLFHAGYDLMVIIPILVSE
jgi:membrane protease YdiL (CAAX protease family)